MGNFNALVTCLSSAISPRSYLSGLTLSTPGGSASFGVAVGVATSDDTTTFLKLASPLSKNTGAWAVGSAAGSLDTGTIANNTWYHVFLIERIDTGVVDVLTSLSAAAPTLPANYTKQRRVGSMKTDGSAHWLLFTQVGDEFIWSANVVELGAAPITNASGNTVALGGVPTGVQVNVLFHGAINPSTSANGVLFTSLDEADVAVLGGTGSRNASLWAQAPNQFLAGDFNKRTTTSAQIRWRAYGVAGVPDMSIYTYGWIDHRGRDQ
jgi:hypothetical protein